MFRKYAIEDCDTLEEFMDKYYKHERYKGRGEIYAHSLFMSNRIHLLETGYVIISHHDSVNGRIVSFYPQNK